MKNGGQIPWRVTAICETSQDLLSDGKTPYERRFGEPFKGPIVPFGAMIEYRPISAKDLSRLYKFGKKVLPGIFLGYVLHARGIWKGDMLVADVVELESWTHLKSMLKDSMQRKCSRPKMVKMFFPRSQMEQSNYLEEIRLLRTSTSIQDSPDRGEEQGNLLEESDGSSSTPFQDSSPDDGEARYDFWSISGNYIYRHHVEPRVKLYVPREESCLIPLKYIDVTRATSTSLDVMLEKSIDDHWNVDGDRDLSDTWTGFTRFTLLDEKPPDGCTRFTGRLTRKQTTSRPDTLWPEMWKDMSEASKRKQKLKWAIEKPKLDNARKLRGIYFIDPADDDFKENC